MSPPGTTVLMVDDSREDRAVVRRLLRDSGRAFTLVEAEDGAGGLERCKELLPDVVLLDYHLPDVKGAEFLRALRDGSPAGLPVPVVLLTGRDDSAVAVATLNQGAQDYVVKGTLSGHGLARALENAIEKFRIQHELAARTAAYEALSDTLAARNAELENIRGVLQAKLTDLADATRAKDQFLTVMSHEMRTPLNAILGYAELLEMGIGGELADGQRAHLERIRVGSRHLLDLINDLLDLAKADTRMLELDLRPVDAPAVIEEVAALLEIRSEAQGIGIEVQTCPPPVPYVMADLQRLRQILVNLVGNAIKFTERGHITVRCAPGDDGMLRVEVSDTGIGIGPDVLPLVFEEFYQADSELTRARGGSGLGLAISRRLARLMGGDIVARSTAGTGSVFTLSIPLAASGSTLRSDDVERLGTRRDDRAGRTRHEGGAPVTVVAYGPRADALTQLEQRVHPNVKLVWTTSGGEVPALALRERATLVVLDVATGSDAWSAAHALRDVPELGATAVLLLPSIPEDAGDDGAGGLDLGWVSLVPKPFTAEQLTTAVSTATRGHDAEGAAPAIESCDVLIVDDDADSRKVAAKFLAASGVVVREAVDGEHALEDMRRKAPDVAVLDLMMPVLDGFGVLAAMRADPLLAGIPVVVLSAKSLTEAERQFLARTASRVLQKGEHRLSDVAALVLRAAAGNPVRPSAAATASGSG